ncbi:MAG TPA: hypothetical protein ENJ60_07460, partial [Aeromonadales bacterium]|nr:hypothetical protein [Aeromonadales bacterium]
MKSRDETVLAQDNQHHSQQSMQAWAESSPFSAGSASYLESLYEQYLENPDSVDEQWQQQFAGLLNSVQNDEIAHSAIKNYFKDIARQKKSSNIQIVSTDLKQIGVLQLIMAYRKHGHRIARTDPLGIKKPED